MGAPSKQHFNKKGARRYLLVAHLSTDAKVEHLPADRRKADDSWRYVPTVCGKTGKWSRVAPREDKICERCSRLTTNKEKAHAG